MRLRHGYLATLIVIVALCGVAEQAGARHSGVTPIVLPAEPSRGVLSMEAELRTRLAAAATAAPQDTSSQRGTGSAGRDTVAVPSPEAAVPIGQDTATAPNDTLAADTLAADTGAVALTLGLRTMPFPFAVDFHSRLPDPFRQRPELRPRLRNWGEEWAEELSERVHRVRRDLWRRTLFTARERSPSPPTVDERGEALAAALDTAATDSATTDTTPVPSADTLGAGAAGGLAAPADSSEDAPEPDELLPDVLSEYADMRVALQGRIEMGGGWTRVRPCDVTLRVNCSPGLLPQLEPDLQFGTRVGGTISDRINVNVDYDNRREFDAANNINVFYQGLEDEILQRVEVGDVSLQLPQSRYLTRGIPAGNFGFRATGQMGPIDFQTVWAQQKGDVGTRELQLGGGGQGFEQTATTILDDADYERGRFFFLFNPRRLSRYPHIDIQRLNTVDAPPSLQPASAVKVYRYEAFRVGRGNQIPEGFIKAVGVAVDTLTTPAGGDTVVTDTLSGLFRPLVSGEDYILHHSGLWLQLRNTLPSDEGLAVTYRAADGSEIGTFDAEAVSDAHSQDPENVPPPTLALLKGVNHRPGTATWAREMHNVYRVSASPGVVRSSIELTISQGDPELGNTFRAAPGGTQLEFMKIFGLDDDPTDNELDESQIFEPTLAGAEGTSGPVGTYIVFPTLEPFRSPPPLRDVPGLSGDPFPLDPGDRNRTIYDDPNDQVRRGANLYQLTIDYRQRFEGFVSTIALGTGGVREGSERVTIGDVELVRGEDYTVDYDIGQIELLDPDRWFRDNPNASVRVSFEQKPLFELAPTSVFGFQARYGLGRVGELNFIGLSQSEKTLQTRPELGLEPSAVKLGGVSGRLRFEPRWLTRLADALPGVNASAPSAIDVNGELAMSLPTTNTEGVTFVEDFEGGPGFTTPLVSRAWFLGSAPSTIAGAEMIAPAVLNESNAAELVWQDQYSIETADGGVQIVGGLLPNQIDQELQIRGTPTPEPVLFITARRPENRMIGSTPSSPPGPAWRSITSVLSPNGQDMTNIEFLEFYVAVPDALEDSANLILDLGTVSEDAFALDSLGRATGIGRLDREVDPPQIWSIEDDVGLWPNGCQAERGVRIYPLGDVSANCTANNGREDTEDFNQNAVLDQEERFFRYVIRIGDGASPYFVRDARTFGDARFRLFRVPLRRPDHRERASEAEFQNIRHLRVTVTAGADLQLMLARFRFLGSRWLKRGRAGVVTGLTDTTSVTNPAALVEVGPISTLDDRYVSPPGISDQVANRADQFTVETTEFNEQSLRVRAAQLGPDERAEVYLQYPQTPRDFRAYRSLRAWALGAEGPWGDGQPLRFVVKLGEDARNFYLYQTPLPEVPPGADRATLRQGWLPELEIDFARFIALRSRAEEIILQQGGLPTDSTLEVWDVDVFEDGDSSYAVVLSQRSRAPNLAAIRQISLGIHNRGSATVSSGELWVDDMRLDSPVDNAGMVGEVNVDIRGSDLFGISASYASENPYFRQLGQDPGFLSTERFRIGGRLQMGRFMPDGWGVSMPVSVGYSNQGTQPLLLPRTDIRGDQLESLRTPISRSFRADVSLSKRSSTDARWIGWFLDNSSLRLSFDRRSSRTSRSRTEAEGLTAGYGYRSNIGDVSLPLLPGFLGKLLSFLPGDAEDGRLRLTPRSIQFSANYIKSDSDTRRFNQIIELADDTTATPIRRFDERLQTATTLNLNPLNAVEGQLNFSQERELVPTRELVQGAAARRLINEKRGGMFAPGWEIGRSLNANLRYRPEIVNWLRPQASVDTRFRLSRNASFITVEEGDTVLTSTFNNARTLNTSVAFNAPLLLRELFGTDPGGVLAALLAGMDRVDVFSANWTHALTSNFDRRRADPGFGYQLGLGGFDAFRLQDQDSASRVLENRGLSLSSGLRLPFGIGVNFDFTESDADVWTPVVQSNRVSTTWPNVRVSWNRLPLPSALQQWVRRLGIRTGYTLRTTSDEVEGANQDRESRIETLPLNVSLSLTTGWSLSYNLTLNRTQRRDPTGATFGNNENHAVQLNARFQAPSSFSAMDGPIRASLRFTQNTRDECRRLGAEFVDAVPRDPSAPECEPFTDLRIRRVDITVDTDVEPFVFGLQAGWNDRQSDLGERPGSTQLEITLFGQFLFQTGVIR